MYSMSLLCKNNNSMTIHYEKPKTVKKLNKKTARPLQYACDINTIVYYYYVTLYVIVLQSGIISTTTESS